MNASKKVYSEYCKLNKGIPLFLSCKWYDALYGDDWEVIVSEKNGNLQGFMPIIKTKKRSFNLVRPPYLTPYQGVFFVYPDNQKYTSKLSFEVEVMKDVIAQLPSIDSFEQKFPPAFTNWLPFYWDGFEQTTQYTYIIKNIKDSERVFSGFKENIRREIRKAEKTLTVKTTTDIKGLYHLKRMVYKNKGLDYPIPQDILIKAFDFCRNNDCGELLAAEDEEGRVHSYLFYVWDDTTAYYLHGGTEDEFKRTGSMSLLLWEAIKRSAGVVEEFNFEGSMTASIERYFRAFGGEQTPYFKISRTDSKLLKLLKH